MARRGNREGSVRWRAKENRWRGQLMLDGTRVSFYGPTRQAVLDQFEKARQTRDNGLPVNAGREPLERFLRRWLEDSVKARCRPRTYALYKQQIDAHIVPTLGTIPLDKLTPQVIQQRLIAAKLDQGLSGRTVRHIRAVLRSALSQAEKWLLVPRNMAKLTEPPRKKKTEVRIFSPDQANRFVKACEDHRFGALYVAMLALGVRLGEALGLGWENVDLDKRTVFIRRALQRIENADGSTELQLVEPKSDTSYRVVSIPASVVPLLGKHQDEQDRERLLAGDRWKDTGLAFTSTIGTPLDERNVRREFYAVLKAHSLPRIRLHDLRHSCATILLAAGEHPKVVQELLGHSSVQLTLDTYSHLLPDLQLKERAAARLDEVLRQAEEPAITATEVKTEVKSLKSGEPGGNRTLNPQIKSLLLCQLSYRPQDAITNAEIAGLEDF
jgi:integrase